MAPSQRADVELLGVPEIAIYRDPWRRAQRTGVKNLLLFFDGVATLEAPNTPLGGPAYLTEPLLEQGLLHSFNVEELVDDDLLQRMSQFLETLVRHNFLKPDASRRLHGNYRVHWLLEQRLLAGFARYLESAEALGLSGGVRRIESRYRWFILDVLIHFIRKPVGELGFSLQPVEVSDMDGGQSWPIEGFRAYSKASVVAADLQQVSLDLEDVPLDEVLAFRAEQGAKYRRYAAEVRRFLVEMSVASAQEQARALAERREALRDEADSLRKLSTRSWGRPLLSFGLSIGGAAVALGTHNYVGAGLALGSGLLGLKPPAGEETAYTYLLQAGAQLSRQHRP